MEIVVREGTDFTEIVLIGELDTYGAIDLDVTLRKVFDSRLYLLLFDCKQLMYVSSAGLGVFMSYIEEMKSNNGQFILYGMNENVHGIFTILGLDKLLPIVPDFESARTALHEG